MTLRALRYHDGVMPPVVVYYARIIQRAYNSLTPPSVLPPPNVVHRIRIINTVERRELKLLSRLFNPSTHI